MKQKLLALPLIFLMAILIATGLTASAYSEDADTLFTQSRWREALQAYQMQVRAECLNQKATNLKPEDFFSTLLESDSDTFLKAHCLFERGALAFIKKDTTLATKEWTDCRDTLAATPAASDIFLRRVNMALAQLWVRTLSSKDLKFFQDGLGQICQIIDDAPLPENSAEFRYQLQQEYLCITAKTVFSAIQSLYGHDQSEAYSVGVVSQKLTELWSKKALCKLLSDETVNTSKSHEALVDRMIFADADRNVATGLYGKLREMWRATPPPAYSDIAALMCVFAAEATPDAFSKTMLNNDLDIQKLDRSRFSDAVFRVLKTSENFRVANRDQLLQGISKRLDLLTWPDPAPQSDMAIWLARAGCGAEALQLLQPLKGTPSDSPIYPRLCVALTQIYYRVGNFDESLAIAGTVPETGPVVPAEIFYWRALSYAKLRKGSSAIDSLKTFLAKAPASEEAPEACFFLATLCLSAGKTADAQRYFQQTSISYAGTSYAVRAKAFSRNLK